MDINKVNATLNKAIADLQSGEVEGLAEEVMFESSNDGKFVTPTARLTWTMHNWKLEELPQKGKKKLRVSSMQNVDGLFRGHKAPHHFIAGNILRDAKLTRSDTYDKVKAKIDRAYQKAFSDLSSGQWAEWLEQNDWVKNVKWQESPVHYLKVEPEGMVTIQAKGKDFSVKSEWTTFSAYSPHDAHDYDPSYTQYEAKSAAAGRKLYKILQKNPRALSGVSWNEFNAWLTKKKIAFDTHFSQWR